MRILTRNVCTAMAALCAIPASATLHDRGNGLIYDDVLKITWLQDANLSASESFGVWGILPYSGGQMSASTAAEWIGAMNAAAYKGFSDWRLPKVAPMGAAWKYGSAYDGSRESGYNVSAPGSAFPGSTASEMAYMFYNNLGLRASCDVTGHCDWGGGVPGVPYGGATDLAVGGVTIHHLRRGTYWSGSFAGRISPGAVYSGPYSFGFSEGYQGVLGWGAPLYAWAVRDGDVAVVPEPESVSMLVLGLALVSSVARRTTSRRHRE